jgi:Protein of unknown function (DUF3102)
MATMTKQPKSSATETILAQNAEAIRALGKRVIADIIEIGRLLTETKKIAGHGGWLPWLDREFGWTSDTAQNFMAVHSMVAKNGNFPDLNLPVSGLYLLAAPSTPEEAREAVIARAESGERLSVKDVRNQIEEARTKHAPETADRQPARKPTTADGKARTTTPEPKMEKSGGSELLNSLAWSDASVAQRTKCLDAIGAKQLWDAMSPSIRDAVRELANVKPPEPAKPGSVRPDLAIPDDLSIPEFLRRT